MRRITVELARSGRSVRSEGCPLGQLGPGENDIDRQLAQVTSASEVDSELAKMKAQLGAGMPQ
jgi:phage shock protein A